MRLAPLLVLLTFSLTTSAFSQDENSSKAAAQKSSDKPKKVSAPPKKPEKAPDKYYASFETTKGRFVIEVTRKWAPIGADQFYNLVKSGYYDGAKFFRVVPGFVVQWGLAADPKATANWRKTLKDEPVVASNLRGYITYAKTGAPNSRTTQVYINLKDNKRLDAMGFAPFGKVVSGLDVVEKFFSGYDGRTPRDMQYQIEKQGNKYLEREFPKLDSIKKAMVLKKKPAAADVGKSEGGVSEKASDKSDK